eukprot:s971_g2.t1
MAHSKQRLADRARVWQELDACLHSLPRRNVLLLAGDFNCSLPCSPSYTGPEEFFWRSVKTKGAGHPDRDLFMQLLRHHGLNALNSHKPQLGPSYVKGDHCSRIDYALTRKQFADGAAQDISYCWTAPFVSADQEGHVPMVGQLLKFWIPPKWDSTNAGISYQQRLQGRAACRSDSVDWQQFVLDSGQQLHRCLAKAIASDTEQPDLIPALHRIASQSFSHHFPAGHKYSHSRSDTEGPVLLLNKWQHRKQYLSYTVCNVQSVFAAWFHLSRFNALRKQHHRHAIQVRKLRFHEAIQSAQSAADCHDTFKLYQIIHSFSPKIPRKRIQLRNTNGQLASPIEELAILKHHVHEVWKGPAEFPTTDPGIHELPFTEQELAKSLREIPATKAVARPCAPGIIWSAHADLLAPQLYQILQRW